MAEEDAKYTIIEYRPIVGFPRYREALDMAIKALEKQIPKKMSIGNDNGRPRKRCGNCGCFVLPESNYCSKCGQKLDWSEV